MSDWSVLDLAIPADGSRAARARRLLAWTSRLSTPVLRWALGVVFLWFGGLKLLGTSPATGLVVATAEGIRLDVLLPPSVVVLLVGGCEVLVGLCLLYRPLLPVGVVLLFLQLPATFLPLVLLPELTFAGAPHRLTVEGQYIVKNLVLVGAGLAVAGTLEVRCPHTSDGDGTAEASAADDGDDLSRTEDHREPGEPAGSDPSDGACEPDTPGIPSVCGAAENDSEDVLATIEPSTRRLRPGERLAVHAADATGPRTWIRSLEWSFGDGATDTGRSSEHGYEAPGAYTVSLTATDSRGRTSTDEVEITVVRE